ncbi:MAG: class I SAM-dependent methyltransferase [Actinomycetota bacterium]
MRLELLKWLRCPSCHAGDLQVHVFEPDGESVVANGVLTCGACDMAYKIEDRIAELIVREPLWHTVGNPFTNRFAKELSEMDLGARPDPARLVDEHKVGQSEIFDEIVNFYEGMTDSVFWREVDRKVAGLWRPHLEKHSMILEVGCGNGRISRPLATENRVVVGVDISRGMLAKAIEDATDNESLFYVMGDAENLPFQDQIFDASLIYGVLHHLSEPADCLKEVARVMQIGGEFFALENNRSLFRGLFDLLVKMKKLWEEHPSEHYVMSAEEIKDWGAAAGMQLATETMVYLPPHFVNPLPAGGARTVLETSERLLGSLPLLRHHGGLLHIRGSRGA